MSPPDDRNEFLDLLRGVAILGILVVNLAWYSRPALYEELGPGRGWSDPRDRAAHRAITVFDELEFLTIFSLVFGAGFALTMRKAEERGVPFARQHVRRMRGLLAIGLAHGLLLWHGDILTGYALLGLLFLPFRRLRDRTILLLGAGCLLLYAVPLAILFLLNRQGDLAARFQEWVAHQDAASMRAYAHGTLAEVQLRRMFDFAVVYALCPATAPLLGSTVLLGFLAQRRGLLENPGSRPWLALGVAVGGFAVGLAAFAALFRYGFQGGTLAVVLGAAGVLGGPILGFAYMGVLAFLSRWRLARWAFQPFAAVGQMALTNYLAQSAVATTIFYSYGFGKYGTVGPYGTLRYAAAIFVVQVVASPLWLRFFRYGPVEWLWRWATYGSRPALRRRGIGQSKFRTPV